MPKKRTVSSTAEDHYGNLPQWMQAYFSWHSEQRSALSPENWKDRRYLILSCRRRNQCGGLSDRLKPLPFFILIANRTNRLFMIHWDKPAALEEFLVPNQANWSVPDWMIQKINDNEVDSKNQRGTTALIKLKHESPVAVFTQVQDFHGGSFVYDELVTEIFNGTSTTDRYFLIYHDLFRYLFKPSPPVASLIDDQMRRHHLQPGEYSIAHYRAFYAMEHQKDVVTIESLKKTAINAANCGSVLRPGGPVYFASDSKVAVEAAVAYGREHNRSIVSFDGPEPVHIEKEWEAFGRGGFGRYALMMGYNSTCELRHFNKGRTTKCEWKD
eukprot:scaffold24525_cov162-Cylindrotheca_fusiformis.AAC.7